jgi:tetraacyldisaccharide 4'-kinase
VVSIGNLTVGGTGKTPLVIHLAELLRDQGKRPAILSRGYGGRPRDPVEVVSDGKRVLCEPVICGDEPFMMARRLREVPVLTGSERFLTGREAVDRFGADVLLLDDGFQHRRLHRDADILLIHARKPFGNGRLLPGGPLREPLTALRRARWVIRTGPKPAAGESEIPPTLPGYERPVLRALHRPSRLVRVADGESLPLDFLEGKKICAFAGIGSPDAFRRTLDLLGCATAAFLAYPDHYRFNQEDLGEIRRLAAAEDAAWYVTTEKDAARLAGMENALPELLVLEVDLHMEPDDGGLGQDILDLLEHWSRRRSGEHP